MQIEKEFDDAVVYRVTDTLLIEISKEMEISNERVCLLSFGGEVDSYGVNTDAVVLGNPVRIFKTVLSFAKKYAKDNNTKLAFAGMSSGLIDLYSAAAYRYYFMTEVFEYCGEDGEEAYTIIHPELL